MECRYFNKKVEYKVPLYDRYILWEPLDGVGEGWSDYRIRLSRQFKKYFVHKDVKDFLESRGGYLLGVIYKDGSGMDMLPCFTETMKWGEDRKDGAIRFMREELFSNSQINYLCNCKWRKQNIIPLQQNIRNIVMDSNIKNGDDGGEDNWREKLNLLVIVDKCDDAEQYISDWRSMRHNLGTEEERLYMVDLCLVKISDLFG